GAYFWCVYALVRRYLDGDLYPAAFLQCAVQFVLAFVVSLMLGIAVPTALDSVGSAANLAGDTPADLFHALRQVGIRNATELLAAGGWLTSAATVTLLSPPQRQQILEDALKHCLEKDEAVAEAV